MVCLLPPVSSPSNFLLPFLSPSLVLTFSPSLPRSHSLPFFHSIHTSESQQEFFRMLDEKIEKVRGGRAGGTSQQDLNILKRQSPVRLGAAKSQL